MKAQKKVSKLKANFKGMKLELELAKANVKSLSKELEESRKANATYDSKLITVTTKISKLKLQVTGVESCLQKELGLQKDSFLDQMLACSSEHR